MDQGKKDEILNTLRGSEKVSRRAHNPENRGGTGDRNKVHRKVNNNIIELHDY